jgi:hypothetical protein
MIDSQIKDRLISLNSTYRSFLESELPSEISAAFAEYYSLTEARATALENAVILLLLFKLNKEQFVNFVTLECNIEPEESRSLYQGIILALPDIIQTAFAETTESLLVSTTRAQNDTLQEEISATEKEFQALPPLRTMTPVLPTDETFYTSTQAAILHEGKTTSPTPTPSPSTTSTRTGPRWETEN